MEKKERIEKICKRFENMQRLMMSFVNEFNMLEVEHEQLIKEA